jgi:tetratricopeptide (TPR) repeat protein
LKPLHCIALAGSLLCALAALPLCAQRPAPAPADSTVPLFVVMAAMNAVGYDADLNSPRNSPVRAEVRRDIAAAAPPSLAELRVFYVMHRNPNPARDLSQFISFALLIGGPPDFPFRVREPELPAEVAALRELRPLLAAFHKEAQLDQLWEKYRPAYESELDRYNYGLGQIMLEVNGYLRITSSGFLGRNFSIYVDLLGAPGQANARGFGADYYMVLSAAAQPQLDEVRHGYLHYVLDPMVGKYPAMLQSKAPLREFADGAQALDPVLRGDFRLLLAESLIRTAELCIKSRPSPARDQKVQDLLADGFILAPYFYEALDQFEHQDTGLRLYIEEMLDKIDVRREEKRLMKVSFRSAPAAGGASSHLTEFSAHSGTPGAASPGAPAGADPEEAKLLAQGEDAMARKDYAAARQALQSALEKTGALRDHALYGLALVASQERNPDLAKNYFQQVLETSKNPRLLAWSHIYLGRVFDMEDNRELAVQHYKQALSDAATEPAARQAAARGLETPFRRAPSEQDPGKP